MTDNLDLLLWRQIVNSSLLFLDFVVLGFVGRFLYCKVRDMGLLRAYEDQANLLAVSIFVYVFGATVRRLWAGTLLWYQAEGNPDVWRVEAQYPVLLTGGVISFVGLLCLIRILAPPGWGWKTWMLATLGAVAFVMGTVNY